MSTSTSRDLRCPQCGAHARPGADWCTLCYAQLRPEPVVLSPAPAEPVVPSPAPREPGGKHARRDPSYDVQSGPAAAPADPDALGVDAMLAMLAAESSHPLGQLSSRLDTTAKRAAVMVGGVVAVAAVLFLLMALVGSLL